MSPLNPPLHDWTGRRVWIIGASSGIGAATARLLLQRGAELAVSARSLPALQQLADDAGAPTKVLPFDITDASAVRNAAEALFASWPRIDLVLIVAGTYSAMRADDFDLATARHILDTNLHGPLNVLAATLPALLRQRSGGIGIVGSLAGYAGLPKAIAYGPGKAALINLCETLYLDLHDQGIAVYLISPGFVATPLTAHNDFHMPALIDAAQAAREIVRGIERGDFEIHFPRRFSRALKLLRLLPYRAYFALVRRITGL
jgi:NADP-dependent 3-hydroxy acid dehydrogenase YdfG